MRVTVHDLGDIINDCDGSAERFVTEVVDDEIENGDRLLLDLVAKFTSDDPVSGLAKASFMCCGIALGLRLARIAAEAEADPTPVARMRLPAEARALRGLREVHRDRIADVLREKLILGLGDTRGYDKLARDILEALTTPEDICPAPRS